MNCNHSCTECKGYKKERLYRGKRLDNGEWFFGSDIWTPWFDELMYVTLSNHKEVVNVDPKTVSEWTGAVDRNGTKIFEGDFIDHPRWYMAYSTGMKCFDGMQAGWYVQRDDFTSWMELEYPDEMTVIGNIYDNPELLRSNI